MCGTASAVTKLRLFVEDRAPGHRQPPAKFTVRFGGIEAVRCEQGTKRRGPVLSQERLPIETRGCPEPMTVRLARLGFCRAIDRRSGLCKLQRAGAGAQP